MDDDKNAVRMLIAGTLISFVTMVTHPTAHLMLGDCARYALRNVIAHGARALLGYTGAINQAFAAVFVMGWSAAMVAWSVAILRSAALARWLGWYGLVVGAVLLSVTALGRLRLDVHHFGLIVLAQGVWTLAAGAQLVRTRSARQA